MKITILWQPWPWNCSCRGIHTFKIFLKCQGKIVVSTLHNTAVIGLCTQMNLVSFIIGPYWYWHQPPLGQPINMNNWGANWVDDLLSGTEYISESSGWIYRLNNNKIKFWGTMSLFDLQAFLCLVPSCVLTTSVQSIPLSCACQVPGVCEGYCSMTGTRGSMTKYN